MYHPKLAIKHFLLGGLAALFLAPAAFAEKQTIELTILNKSTAKYGSIKLVKCKISRADVPKPVGPMAKRGLITRNGSIKFLIGFSAYENPLLKCTYHHGYKLKHSSDFTLNMHPKSDGSTVSTDQCTAGFNWDSPTSLKGTLALRCTKS